MEHLFNSNEFREIFYSINEEPSVEFFNIYETFSDYYIQKFEEEYAMGYDKHGIAKRMIELYIEKRDETILMEEESREKNELYQRIDEKERFDYIKEDLRKLISI